MFGRLVVLLGLATALLVSCKPFDAACYDQTLPNLLPANDTRAVPWGKPGVQFSNGTTCCDTIEDVRTRIGNVDTQILKLLGERAGYVSEAARFKSNRSSVFNQAANDVVVQRALDTSETDHIPKTVAVEIYDTLLKSILAFEYCSFDSYHAKSQLYAV